MPEARIKVAKMGKPFIYLFFSLKPGKKGAFKKFFETLDIYFGSGYNDQTT